MRFLTILILLSLPATAQVYSPSDGSQDNTNSQNNSDNTTTIKSKNTTSSVYGNELPFIDPTQETITIMGRTFGMGDNRLGGMFD